MLITVDFNSEEAIYMQLRNQIIMGIATSVIREGDSLPSVRQLADTVGVNMHTVNKAYTVLKQEGFIQLDRRHGAVIALDADKLQALEEMRGQLQIVLAKAHCKESTREEVHELVDEILTKELEGLGIGTWTKPLGGYFITFETLEGCATSVVKKAKEAGVVLTGAGAPFPYGTDPRDFVIRIAPSYPTLEELRQAAEVFVLCVKLASVEKLLEA